MKTKPVELFFKKYGEGPPLVILHGLLGASGNWHTLSRNVFGERYTVYAVDLRNHGKSPHAEPFNYDAMAADVVHMLDRLGLPDTHVLGHSMGGKVAMHLALQHADRVRSLVVVDMAPRAYPPNHEPIFEALRDVELAGVNDRSDVDVQLAAHISAKPVRQFLLKNLVYDGETGSYSWQMALDTIHDNYDRLLEAIESDAPYEGPALFVRAEMSDYLRDDDKADVHRLFPEARIERVAGAGHWVHADAPDAFARVVLDFLVDRMPS